MSQLFFFRIPEKEKSLSDPIATLYEWILTAQRTIFGFFDFTGPFDLSQRVLFRCPHTAASVVRILHLF